MAKTAKEKESKDIVEEPETSELPPEPGVCQVCGKQALNHSEDEIIECLSEMTDLGDLMPTVKISDAMSVAKLLGLDLSYRIDGLEKYINVEDSGWINTTEPAMDGSALMLMLNIGDYLIEIE